MAQRHYDLIVRNATVIDGTQAPRYRADVGVRDGRIATIGRLDDSQARHRHRRLGSHRRARVHRRAHARRPPAPLRPRRGAQSEPGRDHRHHRQLRHQPRALAGAAGCARAAARSPRQRRRLVQVPELSRVSGDARSRAGGDQCGVPRRPHHVPRRDDGPARPRRDPGRDRENARNGARVARFGRDRRFDGNRISAGRVREHRRDHRSVPAAERARRAVRDAHAQRRRRHHRFDGRDFRDRPRAQFAGRHLAPQVRRHAQSRPLARDAGADRAHTHGAAGGARLLSLHRVVDSAALRPARSSRRASS